MYKVIQLDSNNLENLHFLRAKVLRPGLPVQNSHYPEDTHPETIHLAIQNSDNQICSIATFISQSSPLFNEERQYRLRGMATQELYRKQGLASMLIKKGVSLISRNKFSLIWCNARVSALSFYEGLGFIPIGEEFEIDHIGAHFVMKKLL